MPGHPAWAIVRSVAALFGVAVVCRSVAGERAFEILAQWEALLAGGMLSVLSFGCYAARFRAGMRLVGLQLALPQAFRLCARALFFHCLVPVSVGNDVTRFALCRAAAPTLAPGRIARGIVLDHALGTVALLLLALASAGRFLADPAVAWLTLSAALATGLALATTRRGACAVLHRHRRDALEALGFSLLMHGLLAWAVTHAARAAGLPIDYLEVLAVMAIGALLQFIPVNLGGLHVGDFAATGLYMALGHPLADALVLGSLAYCFRMALAVVGGCYELRAAQPARTAPTLSAPDPHGRRADCASGFEDPMRLG